MRHRSRGSLGIKAGLHHDWCIALQAASQALGATNTFVNPIPSFFGEQHELLGRKVCLIV